MYPDEIMDMAVMEEDLCAGKRSLVKVVIGPAIGTTFLLATLLALGAWQVQRLGWKNDLLAKIDQAEERPAFPLPDRPSPFEKVTVSGQWSSSVAHYGVDVRETTAGARMGSQLVAVLLRPDMPAVLVVLGWVVDRASVVLPSGDVEVTGYVRPAESPGWLSAGDNTETARFFTLDPVQIGKALAVNVEPFTVVALRKTDAARPVTGLTPVPATGLPRPVNNHLSYAATWFGLAVTLLVVFGLWVRKQLQA